MSRRSRSRQVVDSETKKQPKVSKKALAYMKSSINSLGWFMLIATFIFCTPDMYGALKFGFEYFIFTPDPEAENMLLEVARVITAVLLGIGTVGVVTWGTEILFQGKRASKSAMERITSFLTSLEAVKGMAEEDIAWFKDVVEDTLDTTVSYVDKGLPKWILWATIAVTYIISNYQFNEGIGDIMAVDTVYLNVLWIIQYPFSWFGNFFWILAQASELLFILTIRSWRHAINLLNAVEPGG